MSPRSHYPLAAALATVGALVATLGAIGDGVGAGSGRGIEPGHAFAQGEPSDETATPTYRRFVLRADAPVGGFRAPEAVAVDPRDGTVYVLDHADHRIVVHGPTGDVRGVIGGKGTEPGHLLNPLDLDVAPDGTVVVADSGNLRIQRFDRAGRVVGRIDAPMRGDTPLARYRPRGWPVAVAVAPDGSIYASDDDVVTRRFDRDGVELARWSTGACALEQASSAFALLGPGLLDLHRPDLRSVGATAPLTSYTFVHSALDVAPDGTLYAARAGSITHSDANGTCLRRFGGEGMAPGLFLGQGIDGLEVGPDGDLWANDTGNRRIQRLSSDGVPKNLLFVPGEGLTDVAIGGNGQLYVAQRARYGAAPIGRVLRMTDEGHVLEAWGRASGAAHDADAPRGVLVRADGRVVVATGDRLQQFTPDGQFLGFVGAPGSGAGRFDGARGMAEIPPGRLFIAETGNHRVQSFTPNDQPERHWGTRGSADGMYEAPSDLAFALPQWWGRYVLLALDTGNHRLTLHHHTGSWEGSLDGGRGPGDEQLDGPRGLAANGDGMVIADTGNDRIVVYDDFFDPPVAIVGTRGTAIGEFDGPEDVALGPTRAIYVADTGNDRIQLLTPDGTPQRAWGQPGQEPGALDGPTSLAVGPDETIVVADTGNARVQRFSSLGALQGGWPTHRWTTGIAQRDVFQLYPRVDVSGTPDGRVWVADGLSAAVLHYDANGILDASIELSDGDGTAVVPRVLAGASDGQVFVASDRSQVHVLEGGGATVTRWTGATRADDYIRDVAVGPDNRVYLIVDPYDYRQPGRVQRHDGGGQLESSWQLPLEPAPLAIEIGPDGSVYVADGGANVSRFDREGALLARWSAGSSIESLAIAGDGTVLVADDTSAGLRRYQADGTHQGLVATSSACDGRIEEPDHLPPNWPRYIPRRLATGADGRLLVAWASGCVEAYDLTPPDDPPWRLELFHNPYLAEAPVAAAELDAVDLDWGTAAPDRRVPPDGFSARLERRLQLAEPQRLTLEIAARGGLRLWVDDDLIVDELDAAAVTRTVAIDLGAGEHRLLAEYRDAGTEASLRIAIPGEVALPTDVPTATSPASPSPPPPTASPTPPAGSRTATPSATASVTAPAPTRTADDGRRAHLPWAGR